MIYFAVFLVSCSALAVEVLLARIFSISQWNHLSFMVISIALFGYAASGSAVSILKLRKRAWVRSLAGADKLSILLLVYSASTAGAIIALNLIPLDYFRLSLEWMQVLYLMIAYLLLALPFFLSGGLMAIAFAEFSHTSGYLYGASMSGSA